MQHECSLTVPWGLVREGVSVPGAEGEAELRHADGRTRTVPLDGSDWWPTPEDWDFIGPTPPTGAVHVTIAGCALHVVE